MSTWRLSSPYYIYSCKKKVFQLVFVQSVLQTDIMTQSWQGSKCSESSRSNGIFFRKVNQTQDDSARPKNNINHTLSNACSKLTSLHIVTACKIGTTVIWAVKQVRMSKPGAWSGSLYFIKATQHVQDFSLTSTLSVSVIHGSLKPLYMCCRTIINSQNIIYIKMKNGVKIWRKRGLQT